MKNLDKVLGALGENTKDEMDAMDEAHLRNVIVMANAAMEQVIEELDANVKYQEIKESKSAMEAGKKEVDKRQKAKIAYALYLMSQRAIDLSSPDDNA